MLLYILLLCECPYVLEFRKVIGSQMEEYAFSDILHTVLLLALLLMIMMLCWCDDSGGDDEEEVGEDCNIFHGSGSSDAGVTSFRWYIFVSRNYADTLNAVKLLFSPKVNRILEYKSDLDICGLTTRLALLLYKHTEKSFMFIYFILTFLYQDYSSRNLLISYTYLKQ